MWHPCDTRMTTWHRVIPAWPYVPPMWYPLDITWHRAIPAWHYMTPLWYPHDVTWLIDRVMCSWSLQLSNSSRYNLGLSCSQHTRCAPHLHCDVSLIVPFSNFFSLFDTKRKEISTTAWAKKKLSKIFMEKFTEWIRDKDAQQKIYTVPTSSSWTCLCAHTHTHTHNFFCWLRLLICTQRRQCRTLFQWHSWKCCGKKPG